jgi:ssDNA-binding Zn-finger/Zn-ribbon topoisomerase 1
MPCKQCGKDLIVIDRKTGKIVECLFCPKCGYSEHGVPGMLKMIQANTELYFRLHDWAVKVSKELETNHIVSHYPGE